jgi:threonine/homoserine/homoserine lactone efflux protein
MSTEFSSVGWRFGALRAYAGEVLSNLPAFMLVALVVVFTPGPATALIVRNAMRGGTTAAWATTAGNSTGIVFWALASVLGISALVSASEAAFATLKIAGAIVLVIIGIQSWRRAARGLAPAAPSARSPGNHYRQGLLTSFANPKLAVFFIALFPQFVPKHEAVMPATLLMAGIIIAMDIVWFTVLAVLVSRAQRAFVERGWSRRMDAISGTVLIALGVRVALEHR